MAVNRIAALVVDRWRRLEALLLPSRCLLCGAAAGEDGLCGACHAELPRNDSCCAHCGEPLAHPAARCGACLKREPPWASAWAPFRYAWPLDVLETRFKFGGDLAAGRALAAAWAAQAAPAPLPQALLPVPLHVARLRRRGFNQALELARVLGRRHGIPVLPRALRRVRATQPQTELGRMRRRANVRGAFALAPAVALPAHVALLDDVLTTGATLAECARVLQRAGVVRVDVWTLARAPSPRG